MLFILSQLLVAPAAAEMLSGPVKVIDAANLRVGGQLVRLHGIAAPMPGDRCALRGVTIRCGRIATTAQKRRRGLWRGNFPDAVNKAAVSR